MNEPKDIAPDLPDEEAPAFDEPPSPAADPLFEDGPPPDAPDEAPDIPIEEPVEDAAEAPAEPDLFEDFAEPEPAADEPDPVEAVEAKGPVVEPEPPVRDPHDFGPEPWEQAPAKGWTDIGPHREADSIGEPAAVSPEAAHFGETAYEIKRSAFAVYLLYLSALMVVGVPLIPGVLLAYDRRRNAPEWLRSHYTFQIRSFWICIGGMGLAGLLLFLPFGLFPLTIVAIAVWLVTRCFVGMVRLHRGEPIFHPETWLA